MLFINNIIFSFFLWILVLVQTKFNDLGEIHVEKGCKDQFCYFGKNFQSYFDSNEIFSSSSVTHFQEIVSVPSNFEKIVEPFASNHWLGDFTNVGFETLGEFGFWIKERGAVSYLDVILLKNLDTEDVKEQKPINTLEIQGMAEVGHVFGDKMVISCYSLDQYTLNIVDIKEVQELKILSTFEVASRVFDLKIVGNTLFTIDQQNLTIYDITNTENPKKLSSVTSKNGYILEIEGEYAYVGSSLNFLSIIDISNPLEPVTLTSFKLQGRFEKLKVIHKIGFCGIDNRLEIYDFSDYTNPKKIGSMKSPGVIRDLIIKQNFAYLADEEVGLQIVDISNLTLPVAKKHTSIKNTYRDLDIALFKGNIVIVAKTAQGFDVVDISSRFSLNGTCGSGKSQVLLTACNKENECSTDSFFLSMECEHLECLNGGYEAKIAQNVFAQENMQEISVKEILFLKLP